MPFLTRFRVGFFGTPKSNTNTPQVLGGDANVNIQGLLPGDILMSLAGTIPSFDALLKAPAPIPFSEGYNEANFSTQLPVQVAIDPQTELLLRTSGSGDITNLIDANGNISGGSMLLSTYYVKPNVPIFPYVNDRAIAFAIVRNGKIVWIAVNRGGPDFPVSSPDPIWGEYIITVSVPSPILTPCMPGGNAGDWQKDAADLGFAASLPDASKYGKAFAPIETYKGCATDTTPQQPAPIIVNSVFPSAFLPPSPITFARNANFGFAASYVIDAGGFDEVTFRRMSSNPLELQVWGTNDLLNGDLAQVPVFVHENGRIYTQTRVASGFAIAPIVYRYLILANTNPSGGVCRIEVALRSGKTPLLTLSKPEFRLDSTTAMPNGSVFESPLVQSSATPWAKEVIGVCNCNTSGTFALEISETGATWFEQQRITTIGNQGVVIRSPITANLMRFIYRNGATPANVRIFRTIA